MAVRIRVYPQGGAYGQGRYGSSAATLSMYRQQLSNERKTASLRLAYERKLMEQQLQLVKLQTQAQYGFGAVNYGSYGLPTTGITNAYMGNGSLGYNSYNGYNPFGSGAGFFGGLGLGGLF